MHHPQSTATRCRPRLAPRCSSQATCLPSAVASPCASGVCIRAWSLPKARCACVQAPCANWTARAVLRAHGCVRHRVEVEGFGQRLGLEGGRGICIYMYNACCDRQWGVWVRGCGVCGCTIASDCVNVCVCVCVCRWVCVCVRACVRVHTHVHERTRTYTYMQEHRLCTEPLFFIFSFHFFLAFPLFHLFFYFICIYRCIASLLHRDFAQRFFFDFFLICISRCIACAQRPYIAQSLCCSAGCKHDFFFDFFFDLYVQVYRLCSAPLFHRDFAQLVTNMSMLTCSGLALERRRCFALHFFFVLRVRV